MTKQTTQADRLAEAIIGRGRRGPPASWHEIVRLARDMGALTDVIGRGYCGFMFPDCSVIVWGV